ncbi:hypothetical protein ACFQX9_11895 [Bradyrhizobium sp. GCM10028915]|uniref:hypothetical protein n=1 Tax=Bradyrhizobium sp. GCM10028915 TaxID=3273385 RepID=UPI0036099636
MPMDSRTAAEFEAISAVARHHNEISDVLTTAPDQFESMHRRKAMPTSIRDLAIVPGMRTSAASLDSIDTHQGQMLRAYTDVITLAESEGHSVASLILVNQTPQLITSSPSKPLVV